MKRILLIGADGQLGFELRRALAPLGEVLPATRSGRSADGGDGIALDLARPGAAAAAVAESRPRIVVNAAAYTAVDRAESDQAMARRVNAEAVAELAEVCARLDVRLLHYSTDYVFPGDREPPWREDDPPAPVNVYGRTKLDGERAIAASGARHAILRTAWVYAAHSRNFLRTMLKLAGEREELRVVADQIGSPTPARWLATLSALILARPDAPDGLWHAAAAGHTSWHGFASTIVEDAVALGLLGRAPRTVAIASSDFPTAARRPACSVLDCGALARDFGFALPDWRRGVRETLAELAASGLTKP